MKYKINDRVTIVKSAWSSRIGREAVVVDVFPELEQVDIVFVTGNGGVMSTRDDWVRPLREAMMDDEEVAVEEYLAASHVQEGQLVDDDQAQPMEEVFKELGWDNDGGDEHVSKSFMESAGLDTNVKDGNPKDAIGCTKPSTHFIPKPVLYEVGNVLFSGARKYGAFNWRIAGVRASVYQNAAGRHTDAWQEGQDLDPDSQIHHLSHAIAGLMIIRDAMIQDKFVDDRPPSSPENWMKKAQAQTDAIIERRPNAVDPYTQVRRDAGDYDSLT